MTGKCAIEKGTSLAGEDRGSLLGNRRFTKGGSFAPLDDVGFKGIYWWLESSEILELCKIIETFNVLNPEAEGEEGRIANAAAPMRETLAPTLGVANAKAVITKERWEVIEFCVRLTRFLGLPKSVGEIFGFVFSSASPVTFENVVASLGVSGGSASHGLRLLKQFGAIKLTYVARDRRDYYVAETSMRRLVAGYLAENISHHVGENRQLLEELHVKLNATDGSHGEHLLRRVEMLMDWNRQGAAAMDAAMKNLR